jgi:hypothetical protein
MALDTSMDYKKFSDKTTARVLMSVVLTKPNFTAADYLQLERSATFKSEFHDSKIYATNWRQS